MRFIFQAGALFAGTLLLVSVRVCVCVHFASIALSEVRLPQQPLNHYTCIIDKVASAEGGGQSWVFSQGEESGRANCFEDIAYIEGWDPGSFAPETRLLASKRPHPPLPEYTYSTSLNRLVLVISQYFASGKTIRQLN